MAIRLDGLTLLCDDTCPKCLHRCTVQTSAILEHGTLRVLIPHGWTQEGEKVLGPNCTEEHALAKIKNALVPDPANDPPVVQQHREWSLEQMREVVREVLAEEKAPDGPKLFAEVARDPRDNEPDFSGHFGEGMSLVEVGVRGQYVEISWPNEQGISLTLQHHDYRLRAIPSFLDPKLVEWLQNCLLTMAPNTPRVTDNPVVQ